MDDGRPIGPPAARRRGAGLSRRQFLRATGAAVGLTLLGGCDDPLGPPGPAITPVPELGAVRIDPGSLRYPEVPSAPQVPPAPGVLRFFTQHEARTLEAFAAALLPGDEDDPGAREAGVVTYIDNMLTFNDGFNEKVYMEAPWAEVYEGDEPPEEDDEETIWVAGDQIERYGFQAPLTPQGIYRLGIEQLDEYAQEQFGADFADLAEPEQNTIIEAMAEGEVEGWEPFPAEDFFHVLRRHTSEGMFSDPAYGGNRDFAGWRLVGYPGAQRAYSEAEILQEGLVREPWGLHDLPPFYYAERGRGGRTPATAAEWHGTGSH